MQGKKKFFVRARLRIFLARYTSGALLLLIASMVIMSFTDDRLNGPENRERVVHDSTRPVRGFKSLFTDSQDYDPANPNLFQLNPKAITFVNGYVRRESEEFGKMKVWAKTYFDLYDRILTEKGIPVELKYLSVIESHLNRRLVSSAGAVGPWQLMPDEARRYKLRMGKGAKDERCNFEKSTYAACKLLTELHDEFGDWLLVVAAYNGGVGRVKQAIRKAGSRDFWKLQSFLPEQTRNHVKKYIGAHYIFEGGGGWTTLTASETIIQRENIAILMGHKQLSEEELKQTEVVSVLGKYNSKVIAKKLLLNITEFNKLNPGFDKALLQGNTYQMRLPLDKLPLFKTKKHEILEESVQLFLASPDTATTTVVKAS